MSTTRKATVSCTQHRHTSHRSVHTQHRAPGTVLTTSHQLSPLGKAFFQKRQHILNTHFLYHFAVYCLYCTNTSPCIASTVQSLQSVLLLLYNHFNVYSLYCTITSKCIASTVQSLQSVLPLLYNHFNVYCLYSTITSTCTAFTVQSLQRVLSLLYNHFNVYFLYCTITSCTASTVQSLHVLPLLYNHYMYRLYCTVTSRTASTV
jgi:hypothetical protein